ncbi:uncharacterized protein LOC128256432 [Drosophila gunungcola]|uniref:Uncharacterized protein n=1 Tax=Drosophila gunungcola TaxID=103775 RepID=A0A9P9YGB4_9MUSC|nr:uncharacterized protein LOC128256432 [Drosophila gunungcola]XP_052842750.1 uncharacterized protein LOC128256432 [Drosophila gunungcola]KAI8036268.1 hypothetical protein M5D96_010861 [Drosophila gunungcola]
MLLVGLKYALLLAVGGCILPNPILGGGTESDQEVPHRIYRLLDGLSGERTLSSSSTFALLLSQFLIKQKLRYEAPTRYERQLYYHLLHRMENIRTGSGGLVQEPGIQGEILSIAFQRNVLLLPHSLKLGELNANGDYEQLAEIYSNVVNEGQLNRTQSDLCLRDVVELKPPSCKLLPGQCLELLTSDAPAYGYQRTHQVLLLYVLQHQVCAPHLSPPQVYELLARSQCDEVEREQNAIRSLGLPVAYRDLYLEQATICGLFGYNEFVNWRNIMEIGSWLAGDTPKDKLADENDSQHISDLALVFFVNALLLLH